MSSGQNPGDRIFELMPLVGWWDIRLGEPAADVRAKLTAASLEFDHEFDEFVWDIESPSVDLTFLAGESRPLVQIGFSDPQVLVRGEEVTGVPLLEAIARVGMHGLDDTLWSMVDCLEEFDEGVPIDDAQRPTQADPLELLESGTLWILSLGLGLVLYRGEVSWILVRTADRVPKTGCGPLTEEHLKLAGDEHLLDKIDERRAQLTKKDPAELSDGTSRWITFVLGAAFIVIPCLMFYSEYRRWATAVPVQGKVVGLQPPESPDFLEVEYPLPDGVQVTVRVPATYSAARQLGEAVDLVCPRDSPYQAITRLESRDRVWSGNSPYLFMFFITIGLCLVIFSFPGAGKSPA